MCRYCRRFGTTLVSLPWPSAPIRIEPLPPMSKDMADLLTLWHRLQREGVEAVLRSQGISVQNLLGGVGYVKSKDLAPRARRG